MEGTYKSERFKAKLYDEIIEVLKSLEMKRQTLDEIKVITQKKEPPSDSFRDPFDM